MRSKIHISLNVRDIEKSVGFYRNAFGEEPVKQFPDYAKFDLQNLNLTLNGVRNDVGGNAVSHFGLQVGSSDEVKSIRENWIDRGLPVKDELGVDCCYARQDKSWITDPDGNEWEVFTVLEDLEPKAAKQPATCCG